MPREPLRKDEIAVTDKFCKRLPDFFRTVEAERSGTFTESAADGQQPDSRKGLQRVFHQRTVFGGFAAAKLAHFAEHQHQPGRIGELCKIGQRRAHAAGLAL